MKNIMTYKGYSTGVEIDADDGILIGRVLEINDIITFHGETVKELEAAFHEAVDGYLAACEKLDQAAEKPASGRIMLRVNPAIHAAALKAAGRSGQSLNKWAAKVLEEAAHHAM
jgi:predicted HicB family RNase H-like nuclease